MAELTCLNIHISLINVLFQYKSSFYVVRYSALTIFLVTNLKEAAALGHPTRNQT